MGLTTIKLPATYARDWWSRCGQELGVPEPPEHWRATLVTLALTPEALADLVSDARHYTSATMRGEYVAEGSGRIVASADRALARLAAAGLA